MSRLNRFNDVPGFVACNLRIVYPPSGTVTVSLAIGSVNCLGSFPSASNVITSSNDVDSFN